MDEFDRFDRTFNIVAVVVVISVLIAVCVGGWAVISHVQWVTTK